MAGDFTGTGYNGTLEVYEPRTNTWRSLPNMPTARGFLAAAALGGKLYALGGANESGFLAASESFTPARP